MPRKRRCKGKTKAGRKCTAWALHGSDPARCMAHSDAETRARAGFDPHNGKGGRKRKPRASDLEHKALTLLLRPHIAATVDRLVELSESTNESVAVRASSEILDRYYGKPKQTVDVDLDADNREPAEIDAALAADAERAFLDAGVPQAVVDNVLPTLPA